MENVYFYYSRVRLLINVALYALAVVALVQYGKQTGATMAVGSWSGEIWLAVVLGLLAFLCVCLNLRLLMQTAPQVILTVQGIHDLRGKQMILWDDVSAIQFGFNRLNLTMKDDSGKKTVSFQHLNYPKAMLEQGIAQVLTATEAERREWITQVGLVHHTQA